ncbi:MAG: phasin family protein [Gammaproteobacteria bacterium]
MSNGVFTQKGSTLDFSAFPFGAWKEYGEIGTTAASKLTEQQLGLARALLDTGCNQLKLLTESTNAGELWSSQAKLMSDCGDIVADHLRKVTVVVTEAPAPGSRRERPWRRSALRRTLSPRRPR